MFIYFFNSRIRAILVACFLVFLNLNHAEGQKLVRSFDPKFKNFSRISAMAVQPDGKLIIAGAPMSVGTSPFKNILRVNTDGSHDPSFDLDLNKDCYVSKIITREDGKIILAGQNLKNGFGDMLLLNSDGSIIPEFNIDERISLIIDVLPMPDSSYLVASFTLNYQIVKIKSDGSLDEGFNIGKGPDGLSLNEYGMVMQEDKIIICGSFKKFNDKPAGGIIRLNPDGSIDNTFNPGTGADYNGYDAGIMNISLQSDHKIILTGRFNNFNGTSANFIVRLDPDGQVDPGFVIPGPATNIFTYEISKSIVDSSDGILLLGYQTNYPFSYEKIARLKPDGSIDNSFMGGSMLISGYTDIVNMAVNNTGDIFVNGQFSAYNNIPRNNLAKINSSGQLIDFDPKPGGIATINTIARQPDGKILVGGDFLEINGTQVVRIARLNPDGTSDALFNQNIGTGANFPVNKIIVQGDGKILVGGDFTNYKNTTRQMLLRLNEDGSIDESFNPQVYARYVGLGVNDIFLQNSRIVIGGLFDQAGNSIKHNLAGFKYNGDLDTAFNASDLLVENDDIISITEQSDNKLLIGGYKFFNQGDAILIRTTADGDIDNSFDADFVHFNIKINKIKVLPDDRIVFVGGNSRYSASYIPVPVFQLGKDGNYIDSLSLGVYNGEIRDIEIVDSTNVFLAGNFDKVNNIIHPTFVKTSLAGNIFNFDLDFPDVLYGQITVNDIYKLDSESWILGGNFNTILGDEGHTSLAKIKVADQPPVITAISGKMSTPEDTPYNISLNDLSVTDPDDNYPTGFTFSILPGTNYGVTDSSIIPGQNFNGTLSVSIIMNDGFENSEPYIFELSVTSVNDIPVIDAINIDTIIAVNETISINLSDLSVTDPDNTFPDDFAIHISDGDHYQVSGSTIIPVSDYTGELLVPVTVSDGTDESEPFELRLRVAEITGFAGELRREHFKLYPNPVTNEQLNINTDGILFSKSVEIHSISGQLINPLKIYNIHSNHYCIDLSGISPGLYVIRVESGGKNYSGIFIKK